MRYPDGDVEDTHALRANLVQWIRRWKPSVLYTHDPEHPYPAYLCHRDHRIVGRAALDAVYPLARDHLAFEEQVRSGLEPHKVSEVWLFASNDANVCVEITPGFDRKIQARLAHESQTTDAVALMEGWRVRAASIGSTTNLALAESFMWLQLD